MSRTPPSAAADALQARQRAEALSARLPPLLVAAERVAATVAQGVHGRRRVGTGETFWQFRRYEPGDATTTIDWRQSARSQRVFVRETEWEAAQSVWLWCDRTASMDYRSAPALPTKGERARLLTLALALLLVRGGERVALLDGEHPPGANTFTIDRIAAALSAGGPAGGPPGEVGDAADVPAPKPLPRHAQTVLVGDLLSPLDEIRRTVSALTARGVRGHLLQVLDPAEETLPFDGRVEFAGLQGEEAVLVPRVEAVRGAYLERLAAQRDGLSALARTAGWSFSAHRTDRPPQTALLALHAAVSRQAAG
ncbi:DUF58 domain-containing protein [Arenibaculum sp.]|uniref:DUF58 domain-containing protein n=1 Tax=Arenibaculum sp. TaxID=2865862 RepID=UPI002E1610BB|nr:DUF58 domain-containing protein [Arenibaculum sp.]